MKNSLKLGFLAACLMLLNFSCSDKCYYYMDEEVHSEVLQSIQEIRTSFSVSEDYKIKKPGNIYTYGDLLLVGEKFEGIHILDNSVPSNPKPLKFIHLKGNGNFAISNGILLAENGPDLLSIDINDLNNIQLIKRTENVNTNFVRGNQFVVGYNVEIKRVKKDCDDRSGNRLADAGSNSIAAFSSSQQTIAKGKGGSMSKFAIVNNYLYIVNNNTLIPIDITDAKTPISKFSIGLQSNDVETLFPYKEYLYMGTSSGVLIYNCQGSAEAPAFVNRLVHVVGCDPVIVDNDIAFSTVRNGSSCRGGNTLNALYLFGVKNPSNSQFLRQFAMIHPYGLGKKDNYVFICQGEEGLFVYKHNPDNNNVEFVQSYPDIHAVDVIVNDNTLIVTADNGLFQFDISNPDAIKYLSELFHN